MFFLDLFFALFGCRDMLFHNLRQHRHFLRRILQQICVLRVQPMHRVIQLLILSD